MTRRDDTVGLRHMLDHAAEAVEMARGRTRSDLDRDRLFSLALLKLVEIVGEAANRVSRTTQETHARIPWGAIIGTRNRVDPWLRRCGPHRALGHRVPRLAATGRATKDHSVRPAPDGAVERRSTTLRAMSKPSLTGGGRRIQAARLPAVATDPKSTARKRPKHR